MSLMQRHLGTMQTRHHDGKNAGCVKLNVPFATLKAKAAGSQDEKEMCTFLENI